MLTMIRLALTNFSIPFHDKEELEVNAIVGRRLTLKSLALRALHERVLFTLV